MLIQKYTNYLTVRLIKSLKTTYQLFHGVSNYAFKNVNFLFDTVFMLHYHGHKKVVVSEPNLARHEYIQQLDIKFELISPKIVTERQESDPDFLFDLIIDCSGSTRAIEQAVNLLDFGGKLCIASSAPPETKISVFPFAIQQNEKTIVGINMGSFSFYRALIDIATLGDRYLSFYHLGVKTYPLQEYRNAIDHSKKGSVAKAVFRMPDDCKCSRLADRLIK